MFGILLCSSGAGVSLPGDWLCEAPARRGRRPRSTMFSAELNRSTSLSSHFAALNTNVVHLQFQQLMQIVSGNGLCMFQESGIVG